MKKKKKKKKEKKKMPLVSAPAAWPMAVAGAAVVDQWPTTYWPSAGPGLTGPVTSPPANGSGDGAAVEPVGLGRSVARSLESPSARPWEFHLSAEAFLAQPLGRWLPGLDDVSVGQSATGFSPPRPSLPPETVCVCLCVSAGKSIGGSALARLWLGFGSALARL